MSLLSFLRFFGIVLSIQFGSASFGVSKTEPETVEKYRRFAREQPENPPYTGQWTDPDFPAFFRILNPPLWPWLFQRVGLYPSAPSTRTLVQKLNDLVRRDKRYVQRPATHVIRVSPGQKIIIFGNLYGAIHSFNRCYDYLERKLHLIRDDFSLTSPSVRVVFLGDVLNYSPYSLTLLEEILDIDRKNPDQVIYLRGAQETDNHWNDFQVLSMQEYFSDVHFAKPLSAFCETLPDLLRIEHPQSDEFAYLTCDRFKREIPPKRALMGTITGWRAPEVLFHLSGLQFSGFWLGATDFDLFSAPVKVFQDVLGFYRDSFVVMEIGRSLNESILAHYSRDIRTSEEFVENLYDFGSGSYLKNRAAQAAVHQNPPYFFGCSGPLTGTNSPMFNQIKRGLEVACMEANLHGGVAGSAIWPIFLDDQYIPRRAKENVEYLRKEFKTDVFVLSYGTQTALDYLDAVKKGEIALIFPFTGTDALRDPALKNVINFRASYATEIQTLMVNVLQNYAVGILAFVYQNDLFGQTLLKYAKEMLKTSNLGVVDIPFAREQAVFEEQARKLREASADAIGLFMASGGVAEMLFEKLGAEYLMNKKVFALSFLDDYSFRYFREQRGVHCLFSYNVPDPIFSNLPIVQAFRALSKKYLFQPDANALEGYLCGRLFIDALSKIGAPFTKERIIAQLESYKDYDLGGVMLTFDPKIRGFVPHVWIKED